MLPRCEMESQNLHLALSGLVSAVSTRLSYLCDGLASKAQRGAQIFAQVVFRAFFLYPRPVDDVQYSIDNILGLPRVQCE